MLLVANYAGLYISPGAVPARISLAFLCFLMVLNNLAAVRTQLPPLNTTTRCWLVDFLFTTACFNFSLIIESESAAFEIWAKQTPAQTAKPLDSD
jgi:hypothetical protein